MVSKPYYPPGHLMLWKSDYKVPEGWEIPTDIVTIRKL